MATFNMTREMAQEYYRATDGGAHLPMSDKDRRVQMLQHDLNDGRIRLPPDREFSREYLGEWKDDRADAMAYAATAFITNVTRRCALCSAAIDLSHCTFDTYGPTMAAHHAVCPKRPIEVGDYVRWESPVIPDRMWVEGTVVKIDDWVRVRVDIAGSAIQSAVGTVGGYGRSTIRRIPRPAEAQATVSTFPAGADRSKPCPTCGELWGAHYGIACRPEDKGKLCTACDVPLGEHLKLVGCRGPGSKPTACAPGCQCGAHALADAIDRKRRELAAVAPGLFGQPPPAPALVDGLDREACLARWMENRLAVEGGHPAPNVLTPEQIATGRSMWLARFGAQRSEALRDKVAASDEAERNRVRVDLEVEPWE